MHNLQADSAYLNVAYMLWYRNLNTVDSCSETTAASSALQLQKRCSTAIEVKARAKRASGTRVLTTAHNALELDMQAMKKTLPCPCVQLSPHLSARLTSYCKLRGCSTYREAAAAAASMQVSAQLVNLSTDAPFKLVDAVAATLDGDAQQTFRSECTTLINQADAAKLIRKVLEHREAILAFDKEESIEGCFAVLFQFLHRTENPEQRNLSFQWRARTIVADMPALASEVTNALLDSQDKAGLRLRLVTSLYNMLPSHSAGQLETTPEQAQEVRAAAVKGAIGAVKAPIISFMEQHNLLGMAAVQRLKYVYIYYTKHNTLCSSLAATVQKGCSAAHLRSPHCSHDVCVAVALTVVLYDYTRDDKEYSKLYELLRIFSEEKLGTYLSFAKANSDVLAKHGIDNDECVSNMRLLSLCSLATEHEEIPYSAVSQTLQVDEDDVEEWVLRATQRLVGCAVQCKSYPFTPMIYTCVVCGGSHQQRDAHDHAGLMEARMDQLEQVVIISRCTCRVFGRDQWLALQ
eukprot:15405-Heterococcus_DN1.PRE.1